MPGQPDIGDYGLLGDGQGAALVSRDGSVDWWCVPRFDSRSVFGRLLDPDAGHFSLRPTGSYRVSRAYLPDTMVLRTTFTCAGGTLVLTDLLALAPGARGHDLGRGSPHVLVRTLEATGSVEVEACYSPKLEYGLVVPRLVRTTSGLRTVGGPDTLLLTGDRVAELEPDEGRATGRLTLADGERTAFTLRHGEGLDAGLAGTIEPWVTLAETVEGWRSWVAPHPRPSGPAADAVTRSTLVLAALSYAPSGAVVGAPTTSLPEDPGGDRNWDYRYAWLRDAALVFNALRQTCCQSEAARYFDWMVRAAGGCADGDHVQIVFGVQGERDLIEHELDHLRGWRGSRPVRVGNDAWRQTQIDVLGEVMHAAAQLDGDGFDEVTTWFLGVVADRAAEGWGEPDSGMWEARDTERHYTTSKLLCWVALDRAIGLADTIGRADDVPRWTKARDELRAAILERAWSGKAGAYAGAFGSDELDAGVLLMPIVGFLPATDERMRRTIDAVERVLGRGNGLVARWAAESAGFVLSSYWLADCLARAGEIDRARAVFDQVTGAANDLGLLAEMLDPASGAQLGNFPQALSHVGLVNAALSIEAAAGG